MAAPTKTKTASTKDSQNKKPKATTGNAYGTPASTETTTTTTTTSLASTITLIEYGTGKPDKASYDKEQEKIKAEIDALQVKADAINEKINSAKGDSGNDKRSQIRRELDEIRNQQSDNKLNRGKVLDQLKALQEGIQKKIKDLNASKAKIKFRSVEEVDAHISTLDRQVESGKLKLVDEKRAIQEISTTRRLRRTVEGFQAVQAAIDYEKEKEEQLRAQLDDPEAKAISDRYERLKAEFDDLKRESDEVFAHRNKLTDERSVFQQEIDVLRSLKKESHQRYKYANDSHWAKVKEDQAKRAERLRQQKAAEGQQRKLDLVERLREEASSPAYQIEIQDCQTLIDAFSKGTTSEVPAVTSAAEQKASSLAGVPQLDIRRVEAPIDMVARKKKGEEEEAYFIAGKGKKPKRRPKTNGHNSPALSTPSVSSSHFLIPLPTLTALLSLSIPPPGSKDEIPRVVEDLKTKKTWFEANQELATKEKIAKVEVDIKRILGNVRENTNSDFAPANGDGEVPADSAPASERGDTPDAAVPVEEAVEAPEEVKVDAV
ncbi:hypothetical protein BDM02DRAFT_375296 [Thelephora ganbajun]|uniref:Uncharacterized protein n=1 Tax=Thelephora ganbajun TaxID=370292 RepID=A0ACB6Z8K7_THEGA|nr:hypothetical protein BDM02DRAFT_375296 [Thelephora ganbajun]